MPNEFFDAVWESKTLARFGRVSFHAGRLRTQALDWINILSFRHNVFFSSLTPLPRAFDAKSSAVANLSSLSGADMSSFLVPCKIQFSLPTPSSVRQYAAAGLARF